MTHNTSTTSCSWNRATRARGQSARRTEQRGTMFQNLYSVTLPLREAGACSGAEICRGWARVRTLYAFPDLRWRRATTIRRVSRRSSVPARSAWRWLRRAARVLPAQGGPPALTLRVLSRGFARDSLTCFATGQGRAGVVWLDRQRREVQVRAVAPLPVGRSKYTCTYFWFSHRWLKPRTDGSWPGG